MVYSIEPWKLTSFVDERIELPRFQRKATWKDDQNFKLCISVFKGFPVGVVIINQIAETSWLLDGRQRRTALKVMRDNPVKIYDWAKIFLKFKQNSQYEDISDIFWDKIDEYLQNDLETSGEEQETTIVPETEIDIDDNLNQDSPTYYMGNNSLNNSFNPSQQEKSMNTLLDIIVMCHPVRKNVSKWERLFDFTEYINKLTYAPGEKGERKVDPVLLRKFILDLIANQYESPEKEKGITSDYFIKYLLDRHEVKENFEGKLRKKVMDKWDEIKKSMDIIARSNIILNASQVGVIRLTNASTLDAQNIFSLVNSGGTQLKAEELLSAKPFWNISISSDTSGWRDYVHQLYDKLGVKRPQNIVRWDLCAVLLSRVDKSHLIFKDFKDNESKDVSMDKISLGFKLVSSIFVGGMSAKHLGKLEKDMEPGFNWDNDINNLVNDLNRLIDNVLLETEYFKYLRSWNASIMELTTNAIALEFLVIIYNNWKKLGKPTNNTSGELKNIKRNAVILFDRLMYENATKGWKGSGDSRMANDIKSPDSRFEPVSEEDWVEFIRDACNGSVGGSPTTVDLLRPILYHSYVLCKRSPMDNIMTTYDVDHIIPQEKIKDNYMVEQPLMNSLANLALLPKKDNIQKKAKALNEIKDEWLIKEIETYTGISRDDFDKFSDISNMKELVEKRTGILIDTFKKCRQTMLSN